MKDAAEQALAADAEGPCRLRTMVAPKRQVGARAWCELGGKKPVLESKNDTLWGGQQLTIHAQLTSLAVKDA